MKTLICRPCGVNATETKKSKETIPDIGQLRGRIDYLHTVAHTMGKDAKLNFDQREIRRNDRERFGPNAEEKRFDAALQHIQEWNDVREIHVPKCEKCAGSLAPRRIEQPEAVPHGLSMDGLCPLIHGATSPEAPVHSIKWSILNGC